MRYPKLAMLALPWSRLELPGWGKLLSAVGVFDDPRWKNAPHRTIRGKLHGYRMRLGLAEWSERQTYFLGRYFDLATQHFLLDSVHPGDTLIDVGGNIGMITLLGARLVGPAGKVITFEPNPDAADRIHQSLQDNAIPNVTLHRVALSDQPGQLTLSVITPHTGMGTLANVEDAHKPLVSATHTVAVHRGDDLIDPNLPGAVTIKIDIEGFECRALRGLLQTLRRHKPAIITEVSDPHLRRAGANAQELFDLLHAENYKSYLLTSRRRPLGLRHRLSLLPIDKPPATDDADVAWIAPGTPHERRLNPYITYS
jgi:FkbM family methyltransferase